MGVPGQYPNNPGRQGPRQLQISLDEMKPVLCAACGATRRRPLGWVEQLVHVFKREIKGLTSKTAYFCLECDAQLDELGNVVTSDNPDFLTQKQIDKLRR
jgi:hypothetical protein